MSDEQDRFAFIGKSLHYLHEFVYFLRSQDSCRLVEDQYLVFSVEHLEYLNTLLHSNGNIFYLGVYIYL